MLLTGTYHRSLDEKSRLAIPKRMRDAVCEDKCVMYLTRGTDGSLTLYPEESFELLGSKLESASPVAKKVRAFSRMFYAQAERLEVDKQGRVRIPPELAQQAAIDKEVVLLGVRDHIEIWDKMRWDNYFSGMVNDFDQIAEDAFDPNRVDLPTANENKQNDKEENGTASSNAPQSSPKPR